MTVDKKETPEFNDHGNTIIFIVAFVFGLVLGMAWSQSDPDRYCPKDTNCKIIFNNK